MASRHGHDAAASGANKATATPPLSRTPRTGSISISAVQDDQEALSQALDRIHTTASQSDALTAFDEFSSPPLSSSANDGNEGAGESVQNSMSALYNRFRGAVGAAKERVGSVVGTKDTRPADGPESQRRPSGAPKPDSVARESSVSNARDSSPSTVPAEAARPPHLNLSASTLATPSEAESRGTSKNSADLYSLPSATPSVARAAKHSHTLLAKSAISSPVDPTVAPVNISASKESTSGDTSSREPSVDAVRGGASPLRSPSVSTDVIREWSMTGIPRLASETSSLLGRGNPVSQPSAISSPNTVSERLLSHALAGSAENVDHGKGRSDAQGSTDANLANVEEAIVGQNQSGAGGRQSPQTVSLSERQDLSCRASEPPPASPTASAVVSRVSRANSHVVTLAGEPPDSVESNRQTIEAGSKTEANNPAVSTARGPADISLLPAFNISRASSLDVIDGRGDDVLTPWSPTLGRDRPKSRSRSRQRRASGSRAHRAHLDPAAAAPAQIRSKVLSKDFWMRDENCKECYLCGDSFSTFRRKHHCRTCGQIFDAKCTCLISGLPYGHSGSLRVCRSCKDLIDGHDYADDSEGETNVQTGLRARAQDARSDGRNSLRSSYDFDASPGRDQVPLKTPMMAIPATRTNRAGSKRGSAILEIEAEDTPSRPGSSRSFKPPMTSRPFSFTHKRHRSKPFHSRSFRAVHEDRAPFHRGPTEERHTDPKLPAFHNDSIIDPELAAYISDDASSADEHMSLSAAMNGDLGFSGHGEVDRNNISLLLSSAKRNRSRMDETSNNAMSSAGRDPDDERALPRNGHAQVSSRPRSLYGSSPTQTRLLPSVQRSAQLLRNFGSALPEVLSNLTGTAEPAAPTPPNRSRMTKSASMKGASAPPVELNNASLQHVRRLLRQLLQDSKVPNLDAWEHALMPILLQCTDDVDPEIRHGDDIDIRHYVKIKRIPGGVPADTSYISGVVFTKNLALKSMRRSISRPRVVIVTFPIEYRRHQQRFMSLDPVIAQEKEYLANLVNRITALGPQLLLAQHSISGLALQYLAEANVATAYNVKPSVLEAVARCTETDIISSVDMLVLKSVHVGGCGGLDVKTYVNKDILGKRKTVVYLSGCPPDLGCTIVLRGENMKTLAELKRITEFMVYVVYSLKLETCLMRDEFVLIPSVTGGGTLAHEASVESYDGRECGPTSSLSIQHCAEANRDGAGLVPHEMAAETAVVAGPDLSTENEPVPNFYGDMVEKHRTRILSASPFVKFMLPYLLQCARQLESRLVCLRRLLDQDIKQKQISDEQATPQKFSLVQPEMVHQTIQGVPQKVMEVLHAIHDAEYDKALYIYETTKRQWETYIAGNIDLFDPYAHQNIVVLYSLVCTSTTTPCIGPDLLAMAFYNEHATMADFLPDCTLGQFVEDLCFGANDVCAANGCDKQMLDHHRSYVHGEGRLSVFVEHYPCKIHGLQDSILMWSCCKICKKETQVVPMSENTWKYSLGKYLELSFWCSNLRLKAGVCPHDLHRDHVRFFGYKDLAIRIHFDSIELLEIVVPRARITWNVNNDLRLKNDTYSRIEDRLNRFMTSVKARLKGIGANTVVSERADAFKAEIERLLKRANEDHLRLVRKLQKRYMNSKYYEIIPLNRATRALQKKVVEWDVAFADLEADFFPSEKDITRLAVVQMKRIFLERDTSTSSLTTTEGGASVQASDNESQASVVDADGALPRPSQMTAEQAHDVLTSVVEEDLNQGKAPAARSSDTPSTVDQSGDSDEPLSVKPLESDARRTSVQHLDLAIPSAANDTTSGSLSEAQAISRVDRSGAGTEQETTDQPDSSKQEPTGEAEDRGDKGQETQAAIRPNKVSGIPRPIEGYRRSKMTKTPPLLRTRSQPTHSGDGQGDSRDPSSREAQYQAKLDRILHAGPQEPANLLKPNAAGSKHPGRSGRSSIPRSVSYKVKDNQVSTLARHFEQLSREFEKERLREKRQRAASTKRARELPMTSSKPIVQVYQNVLEAVDEQEHDHDNDHDIEPPDHDPSIPDRARSGTDVTASTGTYVDQSTAPTSIVESPIEDVQQTLKPDEGPAAATEHTDTSRPSSEAEGADMADESDGDESLPDDLLLLDETLDSLAQMDTKMDLHKHERSSLMKMLTNFWAERSSSGWAPLDYPMATMDHIFLDSDIIIREDEPSSLIAFALGSEDYKAKLRSIRDRGSNNATQEKTGESAQQQPLKSGVESSLLKATGTHLKYQFQEGSAKMMCKIFYAEQFDAVRRQCGVADRIVESLSRCVKWDSKGGKTRSVFLKTLDERFVLKSLSPIETQAFLRFAPAYFQIMSEALFHELPTVIAKMLGFFQILVRNPATGVEIKWDVLVMENLFYDRTPTRIFDLKGSMRNRKIQSTGKQDEVLLDENMVEFIYESPLFVREHSKKLLRASVWNDTLFLARQNVMDYSLMIAVDDNRKELVVGIVDCIRTYTWDKKLESWIKDRGFAGGGKNKPTVTSPKEYKSRFREAMNRYVLQAPNCWHQFQAYHPVEHNATVQANDNHARNGKETTADVDGE